MATLFPGCAALVTGASREIGAAIAIQLAAEGASVVVAHHAEPELAQKTVDHIRARGGAAVAHDADLRRVPEIEATVGRAVDAFGRLDICVANAGVTVWGRFLEYSEEKWDAVVDLNLKGSFFLAQAAARQMARQGSPGAIVFASSIAGRRALPGLAAYGATKAALVHLARCLAVELAPHRITVNAIGIGPTVNARNLADDPDYDRHWGEVSPAGRAAGPDDIAAAALFLVRQPYVTGTTLMVDGGWTARSPLPPMDFVDRKA